ncbi:unnamed protein product [Callosobruchus maculatus]|uniref:Odorant receptor n=1 Tax=Callosobruchus maculatus TaxID=64391 RepID=A0A653D4W4_CALMS|nr:unnamed protein product [Callosobruchus maculatus]
MELMVHAKHMFHLRIFLFMFWLFSSLRLNRLPMKCYRPSWISLQTLITFENIMCLVLVISIITVDIIIMTILILTSIQFKMVSAEMEALFTCAYSETYVDKDIKQKIKRLIDHHNFLLDFADIINKTFTMSLVVYIGNVVTLLCIYMYHLSTMTTFSSYTIRDIFVVLLTLYGFIVCYCWPAQNFGDENENIRVSAYFAKWYEYPNYSKSVLMVMKRLDLGISISAGGIAKINMETCLKVVRLAMSYYTFLKSATDE